MNNYNDIINLPHVKSKKRTPMSKRSRAAQFAPFAALTGFDFLVDEASRYTDCKIELDDNAKYMLDICLCEIRNRIADCPKVTVMYFQPDLRKSGGEYVVLCGKVTKLDDFNRVVTVGSTAISYDDIIKLSLTT